MSKTELVFILDRSGSMERLTDDTIGGFNSILKEHAEKGSCPGRSGDFNENNDDTACRAC